MQTQLALRTVILVFKQHSFLLYTEFNIVKFRKAKSQFRTISVNEWEKFYRTCWKSSKDPPKKSQRSFDNQTKCIATITDNKLRKLNINASHFYPFTNSMSSLFFYSPILLIPVLKIVHITTGILVLGVQLLTPVRLLHINQFTNVLDNEFALGKRTCRHHATTFVSELLDRQPVLLFVAYGRLNVPHLLLFDGFFRFPDTASNRKEIGQLRILICRTCGQINNDGVIVVGGGNCVCHVSRIVGGILFGRWIGNCVQNHFLRYIWGGGRHGCFLSGDNRCWNCLVVFGLIDIQSESKAQYFF